MNAKTVVENAFAEALAKKAPLPRTPEQQQASAAANPPKPAEPELPESLKVEKRKPLTPEQQAKVDAAFAKTKQEQERKNDLRAKQSEIKKEKSRVRVEKLKAKQNGDTTALPLSGKEALRKIAEKAVEEHKANGHDIVKVPTGMTGQQAAAAKTAKSSGKPARAPKAKGKGKTAQPAKKPAVARPKGKASSSKKRYDWTGAEEAAKRGVVPSAPDFSANTHRYYRPALAEVEKLVKARDLKGLKSHRVHGTCSSPQAIKKYQRIAILALENKSGGKSAACSVKKDAKRS
jgi:hypothetical protein